MPLPGSRPVPPRNALESLAESRLTATGPAMNGKSAGSDCLFFRHSSCARLAALGLGNPHPRRSSLDQEIRIEFTRFSAFYSPLIATMAGGFLRQEGLTGKHSVSPP